MKKYLALLIFCITNTCIALLPQKQRTQLARIATAHSFHLANPDGACLIQYPSKPQKKEKKQKQWPHIDNHECDDEQERSFKYW